MSEDEKNKAATRIRQCIDVNFAQAVHLHQPDGQVLLIDEPQAYMPKVGETVLRMVPKTLLKESEFCIMM